jgi:hypothetical protein
MRMVTLLMRMVTVEAYYDAIGNTPQPLRSMTKRCLRSALATQKPYALDRLSRYKAALWRQAGQILFALDSLDRRKPRERMRRFCLGYEQELPAVGR